MVNFIANGRHFVIGFPKNRCGLEEWSEFFRDFEYLLFIHAALSSLFLNVIQKLLGSSSSSFYPFYLSIINVF
jgi:hypothetical protein